MTRKPLAEATVAELRDFATLTLGLDGLPARAAKDDLLGAIAKVYTADSFLPPAAPVAPGHDRSRSGAMNRRPTGAKDEDGQDIYEVRIRLHTSDKPGGDRPVPVSVNGRTILIPRGKDVWVKEMFVEALDHAEEFSYDEYTDGLGGLPEPRVVKSYPFSYA